MGQTDDAPRCGTRLLSVEALCLSSPWAAHIARIQFDHWGHLTGYSSAEAYEAFLREAAQAARLPKVLIACCSGKLLGSVNLLIDEVPTHRHLTPWMGQLFVVPGDRNAGIGTRLLRAAAMHTAALGYDHLHLFTSGTLPRYYRARGWVDVEEVFYSGRARTIMRLAIPKASGRPAAD